jgi:hypothetical protein
MTSIIPTRAEMCADVDVHDGKLGIVVISFSTG